MSSENVGVPDSTSYATESRGDAERGAKFTKSTLEYFKKMNLDPDGGVDQCLAIMCKMGSATEDVEVLQQMIEAGMTIAMIEIEDGSDHDKIRETVRKIREANDKVSSNLKMMYPVAIAMRIKGAEVYTGLNEDGPGSVIDLETGSEVMLTIDPAYKDKSNKEVIYVDYPNISQELDVKPRHRVLFNRGEIKLKVKEVGIALSNAKCDVVKGGALSGRATVDIPDSLVEVAAVTDEDIKDIKLALELTLDMVFLRYTQCGQDIENVREMIKYQDRRMMVCASIMDHRGFQRVDEIIKAADGVEIIRGYMSANPMSWNLFLASKSIISKCRSLGKPSIFTTSAFNDEEHMMLPDVANAAQVILEGADCFGLTNQVAVGSQSVECIKHLVGICREANKLVSREELLNDIRPPMLYNGVDFQAVNVVAVRLALSLKAAAIILLTTSGASAFQISQLRPLCPIVAITRVGYVARKLRLFKYVHPLHYITKRRSDWMEDIDARIQFGVVYGKRRGFIRPGDPMIAMHGCDQGSGTTNTIRLMIASSRDVD